MRKPLFDTKHPVAVAVMPLREDAIARAETRAKEIIVKSEEALKEANWDRNAVAPFPRSVGPTALHGYAYDVAMDRYRRFCSITEVKSGQTHKGMSDPLFVKMSAKGCEAFVESQKESAAFAYDAFIMKMVNHKIGACDAATLEGNHVWGFSILTVTKGDKVERWETKTIENRSKYGLWFYQYPSRLLKPGKGE